MTTAVHNYFANAPTNIIKSINKKQMHSKTRMWKPSETIC